MLIDKMGCASSYGDNLIDHAHDPLSNMEGHHGFTKSKYKTQVLDLIKEESYVNFKKILNQHPEYVHLKQPSGNGMTILIVACYMDDIDKALLLMKKGADVEAVCGVRTADSPFIHILYTSYMFLPQ